MEDIFGVPYGDTSNAYPDVFNQMPLQPSLVKPGQLSKEQIQQFFDEGYLLVEDYFDKTVLESCRKAVESIIDKFADALYDAGKIKVLYKESGLFERLTKIEADFPGSTMILAKIGYLADEFKQVWSDDRLLNLMEQFLGTRDIQGNPVWNMRTKVPQNEATVVPWHQDIGYMDNDSHKVLQMAAWIPLLDSNANNGCMQVIRKGHKTGKIMPHYSCWKSTHYVEIMEKEMENMLGVDLEKDVVTCEVPYGGVLLISNIIPHRSLPNLSNDIRWSLDLRWQRIDQPVGFHGLKEGIQLSSASDPSFKINWDKFTGGATLESAINAVTKNGTVFDPIIPGPWIKKWKVTNKNKHVSALEKIEKGSKEVEFSWHKNPSGP